MKPNGHDYATFLDRKTQLGGEHGFTPDPLPAFLFPFQTALVEWALAKGRAAIFADCGLGKTPMQLVWADDGTVAGPITVTNYQRLHHFDRSALGGVVCDESSALKSFEGATRKLVTDFLRAPGHRGRAQGQLLPSGGQEPSCSRHRRCRGAVVGGRGRLTMLDCAHVGSRLHPFGIIFRGSGPNFDPGQNPLASRLAGSVLPESGRQQGPETTVRSCPNHHSVAAIGSSTPRTEPVAIDPLGGSWRGFTDGTEVRLSHDNVHTATRVQHASVPSQGGVCPAHRTSIRRSVGHGKD